MATVPVEVTKDNIIVAATQLSDAEKLEVIGALSQLATVPPSSRTTPGPDPKRADYIALLWKTYEYGQDEYDKNILYISSSALGVTFAFIEKLVPMQTAVCKRSLWLGWVLLGLTILFYVLSHLISSRRMYTLYETVDDLPVATADVHKEAVVVAKRTWSKKMINFTNILLYAMLFVGVFFIMVFLYKNLIS